MAHSGLALSTSSNASLDAVPKRVLVPHRWIDPISMLDVVKYRLDEIKAEAEADCIAGRSLCAPRLVRRRAL
jgi:hypothetical protein